MAIDSQVEILHRLHTTEGHIKAVIEMAELGQPCERILCQLHDAQSALRATALKLILSQAECSRAIILNSSSPKRQIAELKRLQSLYLAFLQYSNHHREDLHE